MTLIRLLFVCFAICPSFVVFAQKEANTWHFGSKNVVSFATGAPVLGSTSNMETFEGCASYSDANGQLLFYTNGGGRIPALSGQNGGTIWNRNHEVMYDMEGTKGGGFSAVQSSVVVPKPGSSIQYYLFTMEEIEFDVGGSVAGQPLGRGLSFFEIDMSLNGGLGGVTNYQESLVVPSYEGLCAIRHPNGTDYWILVFNTDLTGILAFPVTAAGVGTPVTSILPIGNSYSIEAAPNGKHVAIVSTNGLIIVDFDGNTGLLSNPDLSIASNGAVEFSPDSKRLYQVFENKIFMYVVAPENMAASEALVGDIEATAGGSDLIFSTCLQLANDGSIYFCAKYGSSINRMHAIRCPNSNPTLVPNVVVLNDNVSSFFSLPNYADHIFAQVDTPLPIDLGNGIGICNGAVTTITANGLPGWIYKWSNGAQGNSISVNTPGTYAVTVSDGCRIGVDSVEVFNVTATVNAGPDQSICVSDVAQLAGSVPVGAALLWYSPEGVVVNPTVANTPATLNSSTFFVLQANISGCEARDTVYVTVLPKITGSVDFFEKMLELGQSVTLGASGGSMYQWSPSTGLSCTDCPNPVLTPIDTGLVVYEVLISEPGKCPTTQAIQVTVTLPKPPDCMLKETPNAFAPNGVNKVFQPADTLAQLLSLVIYSRFGEKIYVGNKAWDGRHDGKDAPMDVYFYIMDLNRCNQRYRLTGEVTLIR